MAYIIPPFTYHCSIANYGFGTVWRMQHCFASFLGMQFGSLLTFIKLFPDWFNLHILFAILLNQVQLPGIAHFWHEYCAIDLEVPTEECHCLCEIAITDCHNPNVPLFLCQPNEWVVRTPHLEHPHQLLVLPLQVDVSLIMLRQFEGSLQRSMEFESTLLLVLMSRCDTWDIYHNNYEYTIINW